MQSLETGMNSNCQISTCNMIFNEINVSFEP